MNHITVGLESPVRREGKKERKRTIKELKRKKLIKKRRKKLETDVDMRVESWMIGIKS